VTVVGSPPTEVPAPGEGSEAGKELLFGGIPGGARSGRPDIVGAGAGDGSAMGGGDKSPEGGGGAGRELLSVGRGTPGGAGSGGEDESVGEEGDGAPPRGPEGAGKAADGLSGPSGCAYTLNARKVASSAVERGRIILN
jgi:hypothetical protein